MTLVRWSPRGVTGLRHEFDRLFDTFFHNLGEEETALTAFSPAVDIEEHEKEFVISAELPGMKKDDIKINVKDNVLSISGEKNQEQKTEDKNYHRTERVFGAFQRTFRLPEYADQENVAAEYREGILQVTIPKLKESLAKQVEIKVK
jgi:HSP20 family protein